MKEIPLTQGLSALVDDEDYRYLNQFKWYAARHRRTFYVMRQIRIYDGYGGQRCIRMHHEIIGKPIAPLLVDHIDGNGLNNQKSNLRIVTNRENTQNYHISKTSKYPGVSRTDRKKPWIVHIHAGSHQQKALGYFYTEDEAYARYCQACEKLELIMKSFIIEPNFTNNSKVVNA